MVLAKIQIVVVGLASIGKILNISHQQPAAERRRSALHRAARAGPLDAGDHAAAVQVAGHWVVGEPHVQTLEALADQT